MSSRKLFASYCRDDNEIVSKLCDLIRVGRVEVFRDEEGIQPGDIWHLVITDSLEACDCLLLFWSANAARSGWVKKEYSTAMSLGKVVVPVLLDETKLPVDLGKYQLIDCRSFVVIRPVKAGTARTEMTAPQRIVNAPAKALGAVIGGLFEWLSEAGSAARTAILPNAAPFAEVVNFITLPLSEESETQLIKLFADRLFELNETGSSGRAPKFDLPVSTPSTEP
jgi:hypothetical protein